MKKLLLAIALFGILFPHTKGHALDLYAFGSYWDKKDADSTWGAGGGIAIPLFTEFLRLDGRAYFFENSDLDNDDELELIPMDLGLQIHILPGSPVDPYILGGASYVYADSDRLDIDSDLGAYAGLGLDIRLFSAFKLFGEALYRTTELSTEFSREDIDLSGLTANVGIKIHF